MPEKKDFANSINISSDTILKYDALPIKKGDRKSYSVTINNVPCTVYRQNSYRTALKYLMKEYPALESYAYEDLDYAPSIFDCFEEHGRAIKFEILLNEQNHKLIAFPKLPPWDNAEQDLIYLLNMIHYVSDYQDNPDGVFMDDYGLC